MREDIIVIPYQGKSYRFHVYEGKRTIAYKYFHLQGNNKELVFQTNLPSLQRHGINDKPLFTLEKGEISNKEFLEIIVDSIWKWWKKP